MRIQAATTASAYIAASGTRSDGTRTSKYNAATAQTVAHSRARFWAMRPSSRKPRHIQIGGLAWVSVGVAGLIAKVTAYDNPKILSGYG